MTKSGSFPDRPPKLWRAYRRAPRFMNYPLYLPRGLESIEALFRRGDVPGAIAELERRSSLGSGAARAVLAFLTLQGALPTGVDLDRAAELVRDPVASGDAYALFVMGWIYFLREKDAMLAVKAWLAGARQGFGPSFVSISKFNLTGFPEKPPNVTEAVAALNGASRFGHRLAAVGAAALIARGHGSLLERTWACVRLPGLWIRYYLAMRADWFSDCIFMRPSRPKDPFFSPAAWGK